MKSYFVELVVALLIFAAVLAGIWAYGNHQFALGEKAERSAWLAREVTELATANAKIKQLEEKYRQQEHDAADAIAVISTQYQEDLKHVKADKDRVIAGLRGGAFRLRIPVAAAVPAYGGASAAVAAAPGGCDGETRAELSVEASEFLVGFASEADEVAKQLGRCQEVIKTYYKKCGEQQ